MTDTLTLFPPQPSRGKQGHPGQKKSPHGDKGLWPRSRRSQKRQALHQKQEELIQALQSTQNLIKQAYVGFNQSVDPDLVASYVFEINALENRHNYLSRELRELSGDGLTSSC